MISKKERQEILERIEASPYWKRIYEEAPTEYTKEHLILCLSGFRIFDFKERKKMMDADEELQKNYNLDDLRFLYKYSKPNPSRAVIRMSYIEMGGDPKDLVLNGEEK